MNKIIKELMKEIPNVVLSKLPNVQLYSEDRGYYTVTLSESELNSTSLHDMHSRNMKRRYTNGYS